MGSGDKESVDSRDPYNRKLMASWASYWLVLNYSPRQSNQEEKGLLINRNIEIPLREDVGFRIRGPPHYKY